MWRQILREAHAGHAYLVWFAGACLAAAAAAAVAGLLDARLITGAAAWSKPFKFFVSSAVYTATIAWYLGLVSQVAPHSRVLRVGRWLGTILAAALTIELALIAMQAWRGVASHFNRSTAFDSVVFDVMGGVIGMLVVVHAGFFALLLGVRAAGAPRLVAARWGMAVALAGMAVGGMMVMPSSAQLDVLRRGAGGVQGGHTAGAPDGGPGLPLVNWSTAAGDYRVAHFAGLHAMQAVPLVTWLAPARWPDAAVRMLVRASGLAYGALTLLLYLQAAQGRPLLRPGPAVATVLAAIAVAWLGVVTVLYARTLTWPGRAARR